MNAFANFDKLLLMSPMDTVGNIFKYSLEGVGGTGGGGGGKHHQDGDMIPTRFLSRDSCSRSLLGRIWTG